MQHPAEHSPLGKSSQYIAEYSPELLYPISRATKWAELGLDGASMGALPDMAVPTHQAGGKRGMIWVECATNLKSLPTTGSFFAILAAKHAGGSGGECRCVAITEPAIARELIVRVKEKSVADLSVTLQEDLPIVWPGRGPGEEGGRYVSKVLMHRSE